uniref:Uncharacterized protein n=1 Tax=Anguilla anguilla TaxID=7936 RepID=A0A0E9TL81_ANGAN
MALHCSSPVSLSLSYPGKKVQH